MTPAQIETATAEQQQREVLEALAAYLTIQDEDNWCQRLRYGRCVLRKCIVEGGWQSGPFNADISTCARFRLEAAILRAKETNNDA
jgi:hypothetical protein